MSQTIKRVSPGAFRLSTGSERDKTQDVSRTRFALPIDGTRSLRANAPYFDDKGQQSSLKRPKRCLPPIGIATRKLPVRRTRSWYNSSEKTAIAGKSRPAQMRRIAAASSERNGSHVPRPIECDGSARPSPQPRWRRTPKGGSSSSAEVVRRITSLKDASLFSIFFSRNLFQSRPFSSASTGASSLKGGFPIPSICASAGCLSHCASSSASADSLSRSRLFERPTRL